MAQPQAPSKPTGRDRLRRYTTSYRRHSSTVANSAQAVARPVQPATDTIGNLFKGLALAGLLGLGIFHPEPIKKVLDGGTSVIRQVVGLK